MVEEDGFKNHFKQIVFAIKRTADICPNIIAFELTFYGIFSEEMNKLRFVM